MTVLAITDIPRMTDLFERLSRTREGLVVVSEIHRGIEELDRIKPAVIIIQNHLSGLSAEILLKHLKSSLGRRRCRFGLISPSETMDAESAARFEGIMDPSRSDAELEAVLDTLMTPPERRPVASTTTPADAVHDAEEPQAGNGQAVIPQNATNETGAAEDSQPLPEPLTYELPRRPNMSIISAFSQQLDNHSDEPSEDKPGHPPLTEVEYLHEGMHHHRDDLLITDIEETPPPLYRRTWVQVLAFTLLVSVAVTAYQQQSRTGKPSVKPTPQNEAAVLQTEKTHKPHSSTTTAAAAKPFATHGSGRPKALPSFVPGTEQDKGYGKDHPGWENYLGQTNEYRVFREQDGGIKSIQVIDRSGAGIQESYYITVLKEVAGAAAMRPVSSEIKEGYEIRKGEAGGLQVIQYRDAQGGRLRGIVIVWP